jgi:hypothetical protein
VRLTRNGIDSVLNWTVQRSSAADGETPANVHDHGHTVHLSSVRVARAPVPLSHSTPPTKHIFGDFPSFDRREFTLTVLCCFDGVKEEKEIGNLRSWFYLSIHSYAYAPGKGARRKTSSEGRNDHHPSSSRCAKYDAACPSPRQSSPCRLHTSDQQSVAAASHQQPATATGSGFSSGKEGGGVFV